jgi:anti-anti-sigma regulatory factor
MDIEKPRKPRAPRKNKAGAAAIIADEANTQTVETPPEASATTDVVAASNVPGAPADTRLQLNSSLEIKDVESTHRQLLAMLERGPTVTVDIGHVAAMDTAGVQLIIAFQGEAAKRGVAVEYSGQSAAFTHALTALGLGNAVRHVAARD